MLSLALTLSIISLVFVVAGIVLILRLYLNPKDDPRLGRGLQILQSKILVVEDLSKQVDKQSDQIISILEHKIKEVQEKIFSLQIEEEKLSQKQAELKSIIRLFQDRIPFEEIAQRQLTVKYVRAAKLAHQGKTVEEISRMVDLPFSELSMICKLNREQLVFSEENLPDWVEEKIEERTSERAEERENEKLSAATKLDLRDTASQRHQEEFEPQLLVGFQDKFDSLEDAKKDSIAKDIEPVLVMPEQTPEKISKKSEVANQELQAKPSFSLKGDLIQVQKVHFPRIDVGNVV